MGKAATIIYLLLVGASIILCQNSTEDSIEVYDEETTDFEELQYNSTDFSTENGTEIDSFDNQTSSVENSTLVPSTISSTSNQSTSVSTTVAPTTTPLPVHFPESAVGEVVCTCDLKVAVCDVECCCDKDCSKFDLEAFPRCQKLSQAPRDECNTNGFLCIFKDNTPERLWLKNPKISNNLKDFESLSERSKKWIWPEQEISSTAKFHPTLKYKAGDIIWSTRDNTSIIPLSLPMVGKNCAKNSTVLFLQEKSILCSTNAESPILNSNLFKGLKLLSDSSLPIANQTDPWIEVKTLFCYMNGSANNCSEHLNNTNLRTQRIQFNIFHNGSQGISNAVAFIWMQPKSFTLRPTQIALEVNFLWKDVPPPSIIRSGSPGYQHGLPILTGVLSNNKTTVISLGYFQVASSTEKGSCSQQKNILFGEDLLASCEMPLNWTSCVATDIISALAGRHLNAVVGAFGDSEEGTLKDWLPILVKEQPPTPVINCNRAPTSLNVQIMWAKVGSLEAPQNKLTGMMISFGGSKPISGTHVRLITSVTFKEITAGLKGLFAPPPKYEIRLPSDFFYPLFNSASCVQCGNYLFQCIIILIIFIK